MKITKLPQYGNLVITKYGKQIVLKEGDTVPAKVFKEFTYDQRTDVCSTSNQDKCQDSFGYIAMSEWSGKGPQQQSIIDLSPTLKEVEVQQEVSTEPMIAATGDSTQLAKEEKAPVVVSEEEECSDDKSQIEVVVALGVVIVCLMVPLIMIVNQIRSLQDETNDSDE